MDTTLETYLKQHDIAYEYFEHPAVFTVKESEKIKQTIPGLHCKCLFLRDDAKNHYLIAMQADARCDLKALRAKLNVKKLQFGSEEKLWELLKVKPGSVSIFALIHAPETLTLIIDTRVWEADKVGFHPNENTATLVITHENLEKYYNSLPHTKNILDV